MNKNKTLLNGIIKKIMNDNLNYLYSQVKIFQIILFLIRFPKRGIFKTLKKLNSSKLFFVENN